MLFCGSYITLKIKIKRSWSKPRAESRLDTLHTSKVLRKALLAPAPLDQTQHSRHHCWSKDTSIADYWGWNLCLSQENSTPESNSDFLISNSNPVTLIWINDEMLLLPFVLLHSVLFSSHENEIITMSVKGRMSTYLIGPLSRQCWKRTCYFTVPAGNILKIK